MNVLKATMEICERDFTPFFYLGAVDKTVDKGTGTFWTDYFFPESTDIVHDKRKMVWHEFADQHGVVLPTDVCPCEEGDYVSDYDSYVERSLTMANWWSGATVDCDFQQFLRAGENPYNSGSFREQLEDYFLGLQRKVFDGFKYKRNLWAAQLLTQGFITVKPKSGKPFDVHFKRKAELEHTITEPECMWCQNLPKGELPKHEPWADIEMMDDKLWDCNKGRTTDVVMNRQTCDWYKDAVNAFLMNCKDVATFRVLLPTQARQAGLEMPAQFDDARLSFIIDRGTYQINVWCVEETMCFCDPVTGEDLEFNILKDGDVYGFNRNGTSRNTLGGRFAYGQILNFFNEDDNVKQYFRTYVPEHGLNIKHYGQASPMAMLTCPDASWHMNVCGGEAPTEEGTVTEAPRKAVKTIEKVGK